MAVIAQLRLPGDAFELGRVLDIEGDVAITLETVVPLGETAIPHFTVSDGARDSFEAAVRHHPAVERIDAVAHHDGETLYAFEWDPTRDRFIQGLGAFDGRILTGTGGSDTWAFEIRFPTHALLSDFQAYCDDADIDLEVDRVYNPQDPERGMWYGLTEPQREALVAAVQGGYYAIPRRTSTQDLADRFDISDQAVTERLRRAIATLTENSLIDVGGKDGWTE